MKLLRKNTIATILFYLLLAVTNGNGQILPVEEESSLNDLANTLGLQNGLSCSSTGVTCAYTFGDYHVEQISLPQSNQQTCYTSKLNTSLFNLQFLTTLNLASNCLTLDDISAVLNGTFLQNLDLSGNMFVPGDATPASFWGELLELQTLNLKSTFLTVFPKVDTLVKLKNLNLANNNFNTEIPTWINSLISLETLDISGSFLTGAIPDELGSLSNLTLLNLRMNNLNQSIPNSLGSLTRLQYLYLAQNLLSGAIPGTFSDLTALEIIEISDNELSGPLPDLGNLQSLVTLFLQDNYIDGDVPSSICNCASLSYVNLAANELSSWPTCWNQLANLVTLDLSVNKINSTLPTDYSLLTNLLVFAAPGNKFYGTLSNSLWNLPTLQILSLARNSLSGTLPIVIPQYSRIYQIDLRENSFTGSVPNAIIENSHVRYLDLSKNQISGDLASLNFSRASVLTFLDVAYNQIAGAFPVSVTSAPRLNHLSFSHNQLSGKLPSGFEKLAGKLTTLLLDGNTGLRGTVIPTLTSLFPYGWGGSVNFTQTGFCCPISTANFSYVYWAPECYETCNVTGRYGPDCSCDVPRQLEGGVCSNTIYRVSCDIDVTVSQNTTINLGTGGLEVTGNFQNDGGIIQVSTGMATSGANVGTGGGVIMVTGNVTINQGVLVVNVTNSTVSDGAEIPVIVFTGTFSGSGFQEVSVAGNDDECQDVSGSQKINSTSLVITMSLQELSCNSGMSTGVIVAIAVSLGVALVAGIAGVAFFKQRHNRRITKLRKTFAGHQSHSNISLEPVKPSPLGSVQAAVV